MHACTHAFIIIIIIIIVIIIIARASPRPRRVDAAIAGINTHKQSVFHRVRESVHRTHAYSRTVVP